jgi:hypothetical protein
MVGTLLVYEGHGSRWVSYAVSSILFYKTPKDARSLPHTCVTRITSTIIALTPLIAANFIILAQVITIVSPEFSRLAPRLCKYTQYIFAFIRSQEQQSAASS